MVSVVKYYPHNAFVATVMIVSHLKSQLHVFRGSYFKFKTQSGLDYLQEDCFWRKMMMLT